jgi:hypothetical protein
MQSSRTKVTARPRPFHDLCRLVAYIKSDGNTVDLAGCPAALLENISETAELAMRTAQLGIRAAGELVALSAPDTAAEDWPSSTLEAIGWLIAELSDMAAVCHGLQADCIAQLPPEKRRRATQPALYKEEPISPLP